MHCTCCSCTWRLQCGHCSSPGVKVYLRRHATWRGRRMHILLVWQTWRRMKRIWSMPGYKDCLAAKLLTLSVAINDRIQTLCIPLQGKQHLTIVNIYAPPLTNPSEVKEAFYSELTTTISSVVTSDKLLLLGNFNAWVGREFTVWPGVIGCQGASNSNSKGLLLLWCAHNSNCASLTQCSDCQTSSSAYRCILVQKAGISLTMSSLNRETFLTLESPGWSMELRAEWIIKWCGHSFAYQSNLHTGWMWPNHLKSWMPPNWSTVSVLMLWDQLWKLLSADWLRIHQMILLYTGKPSKKQSTMLS